MKLETNKTKVDGVFIYPTIRFKPKTGNNTPTLLAWRELRKKSTTEYNK